MIQRLKKMTSLAVSSIRHRVNHMNCDIITLWNREKNGRHVMA